MFHAVALNNLQTHSLYNRDAKALYRASTDDPKPEINLHNVMEEINSGRGGRWDERAKEKGEWKEV